MVLSGGWMEDSWRGVVWGTRLKKGDENGNWIGIGGEYMKGKGE